MKGINFIYKSGLVVFLFLLNSSCKKFLVVDSPIDQTTSKSVFARSSTSIAAMTGIYDAMANEETVFSGRSEISVVSGLLADELSTRIQNVSNYQNTYELGNSSDLWGESYRVLLFRINSVLSGVSESKEIPNSVKTQLIGEAKFTRALIFFYLVNLYGDVPLVLTTDLETNINIGRTAKDNVYKQILKDLLESRELVSENYLSSELTLSTTERLRPNKLAVSALLARVYLYLERWPEAEAEVNIVVNSGKYTLEKLDDVFLSTSKEAILQLQPNPTRSNGSVADALFFIPNRNENTNLYSIPRVWISKFLLDEFEVNDNRSKSWIKSIATDNTGTTYQVAFKYRRSMNTNVSGPLEYIPLLRLGEQYLIRAEARAHQGRIVGANSAKEDLDKIRQRAGLSGTTASGFTDILTAIDHERYVELFTEFGHRWFDLKRRKTIDTRMTVVTPTKFTSPSNIPFWSPEKALMGIPYEEFITNPSLRGHQNPGYREVR